MTCIAIFNQKGGVGKTVTALNLSAAISKKFKNPLVIDLDPQGYLSQMLEDAALVEKHGIYHFYKNHQSLHDSETVLPKIGGLIPSHRELLKVDTAMGKSPTILNKLNTGLQQLQRQTGARNVVIDCCSCVGVLSLSAIFAADLVIVPVASDYMSLASAKKMAKMLDALAPVLKKKMARRYLLTTFNRRKKMCLDVQGELIKAFGGEVLKTSISENIAIATSTHYNKDVLTYKPESLGALDYIALRDELIKQKFIAKAA